MELVWNMIDKFKTQEEAVGRELIVLDTDDREEHVERPVGDRCIITEIGMHPMSGRVMHVLYEDGHRDFHSFDFNINFSFTGETIEDGEFRKFKHDRNDYAKSVLNKQIRENGSIRVGCGKAIMAMFGKPEPIIRTELFK